MRTSEFKYNPHFFVTREKGIRHSSCEGFPGKSSFRHGPPIQRDGEQPTSFTCASHMTVSDNPIITLERLVWLDNVIGLLIRSCFPCAAGQNGHSASHNTYSAMWPHAPNVCDHAHKTDFCSRHPFHQHHHQTGRPTRQTQICQVFFNKALDVDQGKPKHLMLQQTTQTLDHYRTMNQ